MEEVWKDVKGYEGLYKVSNLGRVMSIQRNGTKTYDAIRVPCNGRKYKHINLSKNNVTKTEKIHLLVAEAFMGHDRNNEFGLVVDHINNDAHDNRLCNLQLVTQRHNTTKDRKRTSGVVGVSWYKPLSKWRAQITISGVKKHLGYFDCKYEAGHAYVNSLNQIL